MWWAVYLTTTLKSTQASVQNHPELYGAFPTDPYSHTPGGKGAQQPGMTGQVKEDLLAALGNSAFGFKEGSFNLTAP